MKSNRTPTSFNVNEDLYRRMKAALALDGLNMSDWIDKAMEHWLDHREFASKPDTEAEIASEARRFAASIQRLDGVK